MAEIIENVEETVRREKVTSRVCDVCYKTVDPENYFRITTSHCDWGNDSVDSYEFYDACCPECLLEFTESYVKQAYEDKYNTRCIEIEHKRHL